MLPGTTYTVEDVLRIVRHRRWLIATCVIAGLAAGAVVQERQPKKFKSETLIMIVPQRIPDSYVRTTVTARIEDHLQSVSQQILSRSRLERIIVDFDLYAADRRVRPMEEVVARMRADIEVAVEKGDSFRVSYAHADAQTAQKVTARIAGLFIEENLRDREALADDTNQFLESQLQDARQRLVEQEKKLEAYNRRYGGQLPSQATANLDQIHNAQLRVQALAEAMDRGRERRLTLDGQLADLQATDTASAAAPAPMPAGSEEALQAAPTAQQLESARARLRLLETHAKADHPDVRAMRRTIRDLEAKLQAEGAASAGASRPPTAAESLRQTRIRDLRAEIEAVDRELADQRQQDRRLHALIADYQSKLDAVPTREAELVELTRDYTTLQNSYQSLLAKREDSKIAANLERRNIDDQFKILDPARVSQRSMTPALVVFAGGGGVAGLALGLLLVALLEYRDESFAREDELVRVLSLPVLAVVPLIGACEEPWWRRGVSSLRWPRG